MSRPDDPMMRNSPGTLRGRRQEQHYQQAGLPPEQGPAPDQWHASEPYHYPGQQRGEPSQVFSEPPPMPRAAHPYQEQRNNRPRQQEAQRPEYAPQFARYSGSDRQPPHQHQRATEQQDAYSPPPPRVTQSQAAPAQHHDHGDGQYWSRQQPEHMDPRAHQHQAHQSQAHAQNGFEDDYRAPVNGDPQEPPMGHDGYEPDSYDEHGDLRADHLPEGDEYEEEFEDERPPRRRGLIYAAAFLSAIAIGAGAAVGYKLLFSDKGSLNARHVSNITSPKTPTKAPAPETKAIAELKKEAVRPSDTMTAQMPPSPPPAVTTPENAAPIAPAPRVPGLIVQRPPSPPPAKEETPVATETQPSQPATKMVKTVPITKDGVPVVPPVEPPQQKPVEVVSTKATAPKNLELAEQTPVPPARVQAPVQKAPPQKTQVAVAPPQVPVENDATEVPIEKKKRIALPKAPVEKKQPAPSVTATAGFVAVLSSQKSRGDALRAFADLQQKYPSVLSEKQPEVQSAELDSGHWERLVVGPPVSRESAKDVCDKLAAAGYKGCWVKPY